MNIREKCIEAMEEKQRQWFADDEWDVSRDGYSLVPAMLDAVLAVLADPENWTDEMESAFSDGFMAIDKDGTGDPPSFGDGFAAVINHVRGMG